MIYNIMCDGASCRVARGEVRRYPLGGGANLILCRACWTVENLYNYERGQETGELEKWPLRDWATARPYPDMP